VYVLLLTLQTPHATSTGALGGSALQLVEGYKLRFTAT
jgi:hypothetical protein